MQYFLTVDGGGTKINALLFDEDLNILGMGSGTGVNGSFATISHIHSSISDCLHSCIKEHKGITIEKLYITLIGPFPVFMEELNKLCLCKEVIKIKEAESGLLAGALLKNGISALSGTGAAVRYVNDEDYMSVGGWGGLLGDQGSGFRIGFDGLQAAVKAWMGWGTPTLLVDGFLELWEIDDLHKLLPIVYKSTSYQQQVAKASRVVSWAAKKGDDIAKNIYKQAAQDMAAQTMCLIEKCKKLYTIPHENKNIVMWGGAWKGSSEMSEIYINTVNRELPDYTITKAIFESVMAGVVYHCMENNRKDDLFDLKKELIQKFKQYIICWN